jgi:anti-sigma factor RsiW
MNWTCEQTELLLTDYLDGLLQPEQRREFDLHVNGCERCTPLVSGVTHALSSLHALPELEVPPRLVYNILDATLGPRESVSGWAAFRAWVRSLASPRFAYGAVSVAATFLMLVTASGFNWKKPKLADLSPATIARNTNRQAHLVYARGTKYVSDLRVVYEIQSRLRQDTDLPTNNEGTLPESNPQKEPGRTDGTNPAAPRQQNRANNSQLQILASELPVVSGKFYLAMGAALHAK